MTFRLTIHRTEPAPSEVGPVAVDLAMPSDVDKVGTVVELMAGQCFAGQVPCARTAFRLKVTLAEALSNAILRGNGADPDKQVFVHAELTSDAIHLSVQDQGPGLDPARWDAGPVLPDDLESEGGRGLFIIKHLADQVGFSDQGNTIWMTLPRS